MITSQYVCRLCFLLVPLCPVACASSRIAAQATKPPVHSRLPVATDLTESEVVPASVLTGRSTFAAEVSDEVVLHAKGSASKDPVVHSLFAPSEFPEKASSPLERVEKTLKLAAQEIPPAPIPETESIGVGRPLTLADLQGIALSNNPTLPLANSEIEKERGLRDQEGRYPNPTVGYVNSSTSSNGQSQSNGVLLQQTFITGGKLQKAQAVETYGIQDAQWQMEAQRMRILNDVRLRYYDVLAAQEQIRVATQLAGLSGQALEAANQLFQGKQVPKTDVLQAEVQNQKIQVALQNAQLEYEAAWRKLAVIIGCPNMAVTPLEEPPVGLPKFDLESEWERLIAQSPQLKSVQSEVGIARAQWVSAEATPIPDITVQFVSQYDSIGNYGTFNSLVALPLPIFNRNQGGIYNASQEYNRSQKEVERVCLVLRDQLVTSYGKYMLAKNQSERLKAEVLPKLQENLELTISGYKQGEYSYLSVVNAQESTFQTNLDYLTALTEARRLSVEIEGLQLTGGLNPASIGTAIQDVGAGGRLQAVQAQQQQLNSAKISNFAPGTLN